MTIPPVTQPGTGPDRVQAPEDYDAQTTAYRIAFNVSVGEMNAAITALNALGITVDADATAVETARQQVVALEATTEGHKDAALDAETQAGLYASAAAGSAEIDLSANSIGDFFQVVDDGAGGKELAMSAQRREKTGTLTGTTPVFNQTNGIVLSWILTGNSTPTDGLADGESLILYIDDGTGFSVTWPTGEWTNNGGAAPTLKPTGETCVILNKKGSTLKLTVVEAG